MEQIAHDAADIAETVYGRITHLYDYDLDRKTSIIIYGNEDITNGFADALFPKITLYTPFIGNIRGYRRLHHQWLVNNITHEFSHIVHRRSAWGLWVYLRYIFGDIILPNVSSPAYYTEGLGQYGSQAVGGDGWDAHRDMIMRQRALNDDLYTYRQMADINLQQTPYGESRYNSGLSFVNYLTDRYGPEVVKRINRANNDTFLLGFDSALSAATGKNFDVLHREWRGYLSDHYNKQKEEVLKDADLYPEVLHLWPNLEAGGGLSYSDDGDLIAFTGRERYYQGYSLYIAPSYGVDASPKGEPEKVADGVSWGFLDWRGDRIIYVKSENDSSGSNINDLYVYDHKTKETKRLTEGLRAYHPSFSPDGSRIALVRNENGNSNIFTIDADGGNLVQVTRTDHQMVHNNLSWAPDGKTILFSAFDGSRYGIYIADLDGSNLKTIVYDRFENINPLWSPDGQGIIFSSDRDGIFNLYELRLKEGHLFRLTNTLGGLFGGDFKDGEILFASYTNEGYKVGAVPYQPLEIGQYELDHSTQDDRITIESKDYEDVPYYNPLDTLHPLYLSPLLGSSGEGFLLGAGTVINDALNQHTLNLNGLYSLQTEKVEDGLNGNITYTNRTLFPTFDLSGFHETDGSLIEEKLYRWRRYGGSVGLSLPFLIFQLGLDYAYERSQPITDLTVLKEEVRPQLGLVSSLATSLSLGAERSSLVWADAPFVDLSYKRSDRALGSDFNFSIVEGKLALLLALPLKNNTIRTRVRGGYSDGDRTARRDLSLGDSDFLRGYGGLQVDPLSGDKFLAASIDYTLPLMDDLGWRFWMLYFDRIAASLYAESGAIWRGEVVSFKTDDLHGDIGLEVGLPISFFYLPFLVGPKVGAAYNSEGQTNWYIGIQTAF